ncbi:hypothetical protein AB0G91_17180 [Streptomyces clavifer]|uniref:hypothetical protein n=1 Tax=Streptomyces sp. ADI97-07 TaxID=1522762 RepID=UPI000F9F483D|nr:hypothetical protein [Streptomyces sp. ADI97-07]RPK77697.1 hypothetical protein EES45_20205 [Streptomyces sp. ADI97-07]
MTGPQQHPENPDQQRDLKKQQDPGIEQDHHGPEYLRSSQTPRPVQSARPAGDPYPVYHPGSASPELNRPVHERYPQIRATSGYGDPRVRHTGPGPGAGTDQEPERSSKLTARLVLAMTVVVGQLWGLTVLIDAWMEGNTGTAWWGAGFLCLSFLVVLGLWRLDPKDR